MPTHVQIIDLGQDLLFCAWFWFATIYEKIPAYKHGLIIIRYQKNDTGILSVYNSTSETGWEGGKERRKQSKADK